MAGSNLSLRCCRRAAGAAAQALRNWTFGDGSLLPPSAPRCCSSCACRAPPEGRMARGGSAQGCGSGRASGALEKGVFMWGRAGRRRGERATGWQACHALPLLPLLPPRPASLLADC